MARLNAANDVNIEILRRKYGAQNRAIAKSHAALETKVSQLEEMVSSLMAENYELRCENTKLRQPREGLDKLRGFIRGKFDEIEAFLGGEPQPLTEVALSTETGMSNDAYVSSSRRKRRLGGWCPEPEPNMEEELREEGVIVEEDGNDGIGIFDGSSINESTLPTIVEDSDGERVPLREKKNSANTPNNAQPHVRKKLKTAPSENETMPKSSPRRRSSRGNRVNYALPSLRTKMRREQNEFVDAVVEPNQPKDEEESEVTSESNAAEREDTKEPSPVNDSDAENIEPPIKPSRRRRSSKIHTAEMSLVATRSRRTSRRSSVAKSDDVLERRHSRRRSTLAPAT
ncbi:hypothetical protein TRVA0_002S01024 [Trichomonascus vanleenenianus]|uniref:Sgo1p n=1 Tax=Trichomonascus vanleenenianus TaxID=2268995 RepID=UPI003ECB8CBD